MSIHRRIAKSGGTTWVVRFRDPIPRERTFDRKADAERFERDVRHRLDTDQYLDPDSARITVRRVGRTLVAHGRTQRTGPEHDLGLRVRPPASGPALLGDRRLRTLRRIEMLEWLGQLRAAGYSNSTIHAARTVASMVFTSAVDARIMTGNPLAGLRLPKAAAGPATHSRSSRSNGSLPKSTPGGDRSCWSSPIAACALARPPLSAGCTSTTSAG